MKNFGKQKLIIVSNREPFLFRKGRYEKTVGGLVSALDPVMRSSKGVWIASSTPEEAKGRGLRTEVPPENPSYTMRRVPLSHHDIDGYYNGYSNRFLWPLCHITLDRVYLKRSHWQSYRKANSLFADAVVDEAGEKGASVWLQDFHLALCAREIKERRPDIKVSLFWHIPWPPHAVLKVCPQRKVLLDGLLANDLLCFQLDDFKTYFMRCVKAELNAEVDFRNSTVYYKEQTTHVKSFPISVDYGWFDRTASRPRADSFFRRFIRVRELEGLFLGLSVNRLDYTKGIVKCLEAMELFFVKYPRFRKKVTFIHVVVPTRRVEPYLSYMEMVQKKVRSINHKFSSGKWRPIEYIDTKLTHEELASLYKHADMAVISSIYDGMNLVAKEYIASQVDLKGSILISEFAGAADDIPGVTVINPYDTEGFAESIKDTIVRDPLDKKHSLEIARAHLKENDLFKWVNDILKEFRSIQ